MLLVAALAAPLAAEAQEAGRIHRIGVLGTSDGSGWQAFRDGLQSLGYLEGRTIAVDWRWAGNDAGRFTDLAADLVRQQVDLIVTGTDPAPAAARDATRRRSWLLLQPRGDGRPDRELPVRDRPRAPAGPVSQRVHQ
jgi:putative ABC transport system substrate-binding protein